MPEKAEVVGDKVTITKEDGTVVEMSKAEALASRPDLMAKAHAEAILATADIHDIFRDELHPLQPGPLDIGDRVRVKASGEFGEVQRVIDEAIRVKMPDGRIETRWPLEVEKRA
jgi:DNA-directed RNA polymerase subunit E'/Rpb7